MTDPAVGLSAAEVAERVARGEVNTQVVVTARSLTSIMKENILTWFNFLVGSLWIVMLLIAPIQDSLFGFVIVANTAIGIIQEYRASRTLAKLAVVTMAQPIVRRDGVDAAIPASEIVIDDIVVLSSGDQLVVDGIVLSTAGMEIDESLLTGEADPVDKNVGDRVMSGSFVVAGSGSMQATRIGRASFASGLTEQASKFALTTSELRDAINRFIRYVSYALLPVGGLLLWSQLVEADLPWRDALRGTIAGVVTMVPEGLVLLTSIAMAVSVVRLARMKVLVQELPAVETLARVDVICVDKTGTLTLPGMQVREVVDLRGSAGAVNVDLGAVLGALGASESSPNPTLAAVATAYPSPGWVVQASVPFSSARKWSAVTFTEHGTWVLGAPEMVVPGEAVVLDRASGYADSGARVLVLAQARAEVNTDSLGACDPAALVVIDQQLRPDAAETVRYFLAQGVEVKVISGDNATTVGAIAQQAGIPGAEHPVDAQGLPDSTASVADVMARSSVFGRVTPAQKQEMVDALHLRGATVAMTGDGVNDVLALKAADLGIAMGSGSGATRAVAQLVLVDSQWAVLPSVVAEGRRVLGNIERVSDVFLTKSFYSMVVSVATGIFAIAFPFLPRHLSVISALTIGIPGFFLALMPNTEKFRPGFFRRVVIFSLPAGVIAAVCSLVSYSLALRVGEPVPSAQAAATVTLFIVATAVMLEAARPLNLLRLGIVGLMVLLFLLVLYIPPVSAFFALSLGPERYSLVAVGMGLLGAGLVWLASVITVRWRPTKGGPA
jgi:cation-transporting ATPase E